MKGEIDVVDIILLDDCEHFQAINFLKFFGRLSIAYDLQMKVAIN